MTLIEAIKEAIKHAENVKKEQDMLCKPLPAPYKTKNEHKEYEVEVITRGNCMMCGKELTEGLFFCKECENKANSGK